MKTEIIKVKGDWQEVVNDCRSTVGKDALGNEPSQEFKRKILIAEHSPIRDISIKWRWKDMAHWITVHWVRHKWEKFVRTQRSDRTGIPREKLPQDEPQTFVGEANTQALIDTMRKRLCFQAAKETREYAEDLKKAIHDVEPEISDVLVPNCVYRGFCPERNPCGFWNKFSENLSKEELIDWEKRYGKYNKSIDNPCKLSENEKRGENVFAPCRVYDELFVLTNNRTEIEKTTCLEILIVNGEDSPHAKVRALRTYDFSMWSFYKEDFGKTVFLTHEEAEAALETENRKR